METDGLGGEGTELVVKVSTASYRELLTGRHARLLLMRMVIFFSIEVISSATVPILPLLMRSAGLSPLIGGTILLGFNVGSIIGAGTATRALRAFSPFGILVALMFGLSIPLWCLVASLSAPAFFGVRVMAGWTASTATVIFNAQIAQYLRSV